MIDKTGTKGIGTIGVKKVICERHVHPTPIDQEMHFRCSIHNRESIPMYRHESEERKHRSMNTVRQKTPAPIIPSGLDFSRDSHVVPHIKTPLSFNHRSQSIHTTDACWTITPSQDPLQSSVGTFDRLGCSQARCRYAIKGKQIVGLLVYAIIVETPAS
ncbi:hypothetical protein K469DRAFT_183205 [Zopfia rhizophila CBS 207.26]|uniref:Uncharacterized protein n=1 Tax=Zopfia rhizophila CBS 207.26 TaxID=1314779 RepID=A0A6A6DXG8_9PEZI|nr:hypothetical protein K469DRAFT_183205 [Zopfia rhizophila CBS 207.26]